MRSSKRKRIKKKDFLTINDLMTKEGEIDWEKVFDFELSPWGMSGWSEQLGVLQNEGILSAESCGNYTVIDELGVDWLPIQCFGRLYFTDLKQARSYCKYLQSGHKHRTFIIQKISESIEV